MCVKWHRKSLKEFFVKICKSLIQIREKSGVSDSAEIFSCQSTETLSGWNCSFKNEVEVSKLQWEKAPCISFFSIYGKTICCHFSSSSKFMEKCSLALSLFNWLKIYLLTKLNRALKRKPQGKKYPHQWNYSHYFQRNS